MYGPSLCFTYREGRRGYLVRPDPSRVEIARDLLAHPSMHPELMLGGDPLPVEEYREMVAGQENDPHRYAWWIMVEDTAVPPFAGICGVFRNQWRTIYRQGKPHLLYGGQIFYAVTPELREQGIATNASRAAIDFLFDRGHGVVTTQILENNDTSHRVARRLGFRESAYVSTNTSAAYEEGGIQYGYVSYTLTLEEFIF